MDKKETLKKQRAKQATNFEMWCENVTSEELVEKETKTSPELVKLIEEARRSPTIHRDRNKWKEKNKKGNTKK